jgi:flagellar hook-basal body complex protein FliE
MKVETFTLNTFPDVGKAKSQAPETGKASFGDVLKDSIKKVGEIEKEADQEVQKLATMESGDIVNTMMAIEKADVSFQMMMQIRNKIINAYEEIMRIQV